MVEINPEFLSVKQAMVLIGVSRVTLYRWQREGRVRPYKAGRRVLYRRSELLAALVKGRLSPSASRASSNRDGKRSRCSAR